MGRCYIVCIYWGARRTLRWIVTHTWEDLGSDFNLEQMECVSENLQSRSMLWLGFMYNYDKWS
jgi:hypothetical protein